MLYLSQPTRIQSLETQRALNAADGYLYFSLLDEALAELGYIPTSQQEESAVMLARIRLLLHKKECRSAEPLSAHPSGLQPGEGGFPGQRACALLQTRKAEQTAPWHL